GLQAALQKNLSAGLRLQASYTYSKALSDTDQVINGQTTASAPGQPDPYNLAAEYSRSAYDQRHTISINGSYDMPWDRWLTNGVAKAALGGWGINTIYTYGSGYPFTTNLSFTNSRTGTPLTNDRPSLAP